MRLHAPRGLKEQWEKNAYLRAFTYGLGIAFVFFIPFMVYDNGYFLFYGDFNVQQVPFYKMCHDAVRNGNLGWSWTTDLGANFIGSYSFYLLGSPFFWLTLPFPSEAVPYLMGPLLILKFACAALTGCIFLRRYVKAPKLAVLGGLLYAFSGFSVYNIFFNHFHEAIIVLPLLLWALDEYMYKRRRGVFAVMVFACCFVNYYFFTGQVAFTLIYFVVRMLCRSWRLNLRDFLMLFCEAVLGLLCACAMLVPTVLAVIQNPRIENLPQGWGALLYNDEQRYAHILQALFFPPDIPARPNFTPDSNAKWASMGAWLPLFSMTGVLAFLQTPRKHWLKRFLPLLFLMAAVPILNSAFQLFNSTYYARWFYMLTLMMVLATLMSLEYDRADWKRAIKWTLGITLGIALPIGLMPKSWGDDKTGVVVGLEDYPTRFWSYVAISLLSLLLLTIIFKWYKRDRKKFLRLCVGGTAVITVVYASFFIALGKTQSDDPHLQIIPYALNGGKDIKLPDTRDCRVDVYDGMDNQAMFWQIPTIQAFHSIVPGAVMEFYPSIGVQRDVASRPDVQYYGLRALTSCRWLFDPPTGKKFAENDEQGKAQPKMPGWTYYATQNGFDVWENQYYIPMGFSYDGYITRSEYDAQSKDNRSLLLLKALVLPDEDAAAYAGVLPHLSTEDFSYTRDAYYEDCTARKAQAGASFSRDNGGFSAAYQAEEARLVFFSVPWEGGWSASVNGKPAEIVKANVGFMAVRVPAGESSIRFSYRTPGLSLGVLASLLGVVLLALYLVLTRRYDKRSRARRRMYRIKGGGLRPRAISLRRNSA